MPFVDFFGFCFFDFCVLKHLGSLTAANWVSFYFKEGLGILQITSAKQCPQVWSWFGRSLLSTNFVEFDQLV